MPTDIEDRCDAIEECYEFLLAYAGQGLPSEESTGVRHQLERAVQALTGLTENFVQLVEEHRRDSAAKYRAFLRVLDRDARDSLAAIELVLAQPTISSQLIDNLNASIHLRALLTDLFLIDAIFSEQLNPGPAVPS
jgi:hypothetical protein